jgi:hypothetical protein
MVLSKLVEVEEEPAGVELKIEGGLSVQKQRAGDTQHRWRWPKRE